MFYFEPKYLIEKTNRFYLVKLRINKQQYQYQIFLTNPLPPKFCDKSDKLRDTGDSVILVWSLVS